MNDIDKWYAEQCDIPYDDVDDDYFLTVETQVETPRPDYHYYPDTIPWTITDPRCREVCRERFNICTRKMQTGNWLATHQYKTEYGTSVFNEEGKTIKNAEIACLKSIYEARDE